MRESWVEPPELRRDKNRSPAEYAGWKDKGIGTPLWLAVRDRWMASWAVAVARQGDISFLPRYARHLAFLLLMTGALALSRVDIPVTKVSSPPLVRRGYAYLRLLSGEPGDLDRGFLTKAVVPHTTILERPRKDIIVYRAQAGDTIYGIGQKFGISGETVMWANPPLEDNPDMLRVGQEVVILPVSGVYHTVERGETLESIAAKYGVNSSVITDYELNGLEEAYELKAGQKLIVPGGAKPYIPRVVHAWSGTVPDEAERGTGSFGWPVSGLITQGYWGRHRAIDIGAPKGTPVYAADSGYVAIVGFSDVGYGRMVLIDHGNDFQTLYAHLSAYYVEVGQSVKKGQKIGAVGATGYASGPHLHLEIRYNGVQRNPLGFLP